MERIEPGSSWNDPPTDEQVRRITWYCKVLHIKEPLEERSSNRLEARNLIYELRAALRGKKKPVRHIRIVERG